MRNKIAIFLVVSFYLNVHTAWAQSTSPSPTIESSLSPSLVPSVTPSVSPNNSTPSPSPTTVSTPVTGGNSTASVIPVPTSVGGEVLGSATRLADTDSSKDWIKYALALAVMAIVILYGFKLTREHVEE